MCGMILPTMLALVASLERLLFFEKNRRRDKDREGKEIILKTLPDNGINNSLLTGLIGVGPKKILPSTFEHHKFKVRNKDTSKKDTSKKDTPRKILPGPHPTYYNSTRRNTTLQS